MAKGEHIFVRCSVGGIPFQHHGIDVGDGTVIHLAAEDGARIAIRDESGEFAVRRDSYQDFCRGEEPVVVKHATALQPDEIVARATKRIGQRGYCLMNGNCEHFASWCATGDSQSHQIDMGEATVSALTSMATKAVWSVSAKAGARVAIRGATKMHPAAMLADGVEVVALAVGCQSGLNARRAKRVARLSSSVAAAGIGGLIAGPAGAAMFLAAHTSSGAIADQLCKSLRGALS